VDRADGIAAPLPTINDVFWMKIVPCGHSEHVTSFAVKGGGGAEDLSWRDADSRVPYELEVARLCLVLRDWLL
jgi:hypothetical protein